MNREDVRLRVYNFVHKQVFSEFCSRHYDAVCKTAGLRIRCDAEKLLVHDIQVTVKDPIFEPSIPPRIRNLGTLKGTDTNA